MAEHRGRVRHLCNVAGHHHLANLILLDAASTSAAVTPRQKANHPPPTSLYLRAIALARRSGRLNPKLCLLIRISAQQVFHLFLSVYACTARRAHQQAPTNFVCPSPLRSHKHAASLRPTIRAHCTASVKGGRNPLFSIWETTAKRSASLDNPSTATDPFFFFAPKIHLSLCSLTPLKS